MEGVNTLVLIVMEVTLVHVMMDTHWIWMIKDAQVSDSVVAKGLLKFLKLQQVKARLLSFYDQCMQ